MVIASYVTIAIYWPQQYITPTARLSIKNLIKWLDSFGYTVAI